jgi:hypothetical protein
MSRSTTESKKLSKQRKLTCTESEKKKEAKNEQKICQEWDLNPCPFGPVPETGALDQLGHLDVY